MKKRITAFLSAAVLCMGMLCVPYAAAEEVSSGTEITAEEETAEDSAEDTGRGTKIAAFLVIFSAAMVVTAYFTARPSLKKMKAAKNPENKSSEEKSE